MVMADTMIDSSISDIASATLPKETEYDFARKILAHQLEGIMLHISLMKLYKKLGQRTLCKIHKKQVHEESLTHAQTAMELMNLYDEVIAPSQVESIDVPDGDGENWMSAVFKSLDMWAEWEDKTAKLYHKASEEIPELHHWHDLALAANKEGIRAREIMATVVKKK